MTFESLYNWGISRDMAGYMNQEHVTKNKQRENLYFFRITRHLTQVHALVLCENFDEAKIYIDEVLSEMDEMESFGLEEQLISTKVLTHVIYATIQKSYEKMNLPEKAKEMEDKVIPLDMTNDIEKSTLYGIRSLSLYQYCETVHIARNFADNAKNLNPACSYWNLAFALCLRDIRRDSGTSKPSFLEKKYFYIAYTQNADPFFGVRLAQCYKESGDQEKALKMYEELKQLHIDTPDVWLRLALGFIYYKKLEPAKECLDKAEEIDDSLSMFLHYKGLYYMKGYQNYDEAMIYLKKASEQGNYKAFIDYLFCLYNKNPEDRRVLEILENSIEKYVHQKIEISLMIAIYYAKNLNDYEKGLIKLRDAIMENPQDDHFRRFFYPFTSNHLIDIRTYINNELLPKSQSILSSANPEAWEAQEFLRNFAKTNKYRGNKFNNPRTD